ncbi:Guanylate-binding protein 4 [Microtus ochrogaster]|uniref:Guanylate-binding protein 4 n=1 Tax=Microtus ochrogaster TaxID=79684 RepID=A0A8J6GSB9_MICOH|nr:Guanylate-binding protein 4 [Microtus ochrogaster]
MASGPSMEAPICLVENENEELRVNPEAVIILEKITQPVVVVAIVGLYRTGKSYLMNRLAGKNHGFNLGTTVRSETKGIWMWCVPHPTKAKFTLVLLDTEGLGDVEKGDPKNDSWIFALAVLLSSTFVYNSMNTINHQALEQLHEGPSYVTELTELIRAKSSSPSEEMDDSVEFVSFFPDFVWTIRDFTLELKLDERSITADEYLENALKLIPGRSRKVQNANMPRECIRHFFPQRKCFVFDRPTKETDLLVHVEEIPEDELDPNFQVQSKEFCSYIFSNAKTKTLKEGIIVNGNRLATLVTTYVDAINSGAVPCLENAVTTLAQRENSIAVQKATDHYTERMAQLVRLPTNTLQDLLNVHTACEKEAIAVFMEHSFKDENQQFQNNLMVAIEEHKEDFLRQNEAASLSYCQAELEKLAEPLRESISRGAFFVPGGHRLYLEARKKVEQNYELVPRKGVKAKHVLQSFLQSQVTIEDSILQSDKALTDGQKAMEAERAQKEAAEQEQELLRQKQKELQQVIESQERSYKENMDQLHKKMETERKNLLTEQEEMLAHKLKVQEYMLNAGFKEKHDAMDSEISQLRKEIKNLKNLSSSLYTEVFDEVGNVLIAALPGTRHVQCDNLHIHDVEEAYDWNADLLTMLLGGHSAVSKSYVTELTDRIRTRSSSDQDEVDASDEFVSFFPDFVWAVRDFSLELKINGKPISADEYLENSLRLIYGTGQRDKEKELNMPRLCIHKFFPKKKCFVFERPAQGKKLGQLQSLQDHDLDSDFVEQVADFCSYVFSCSKVKRLSGGIKVNGPRLESLVTTYINTINSGGLPCLENAVLALSQTENEAAVQKAIAHYDQQMSQKLQLPTETLQELLDLQRASEKEAIKIFMENSFKDINQVFLMQVMTRLEAKLEEFFKKNAQVSSDHCSALLQGIFSPLEEDLKHGIYFKPGGYFIFMWKIRELKKKYYEEPRKGVQAEEVLQKFLQSKEEVSDAVLETDQTLTEKEKETEGVSHKQCHSSLEL